MTHRKIIRIYLGSTLSPNKMKMVISEVGCAVAIVIVIILVLVI